MKLVYYINYLNHHRVALADEFYSLLGESFALVMTMRRNANELKGGQDYSSRPYCVLAAESDDAHALAMKYARESEVCIFGANSADYILERVKKGRKDGISFETSERWLKKGLINILSPRLLKQWFIYQFKLRGHSFFKLCSGAYVANDHYLLWMYQNRCYKWGYFTKVDENLIERTSKKEPRDIDNISIMWCARFLKWKHPELPIKLARKLRDNGYRVTFDMYGTGIELESCKNLCNKLGVQDAVCFKGNVPNDEILFAMRNHDMFLFTSDRNEGWGAVLNEAMSNYCPVIASDEIGAVPTLLKDGVNGLIFKSRSIESLYEKVVYYIEHPGDRLRMAEAAYHTISIDWAPKKVASNFLQLADDLLKGRKSSIMEGPCSQAYPLR